MKLKTKIKSFILKKIAQRRYTQDIKPKSLKKILIIREGGIGDAVCNYPLIRELKKAYPHYEIDIYAGLSNYFMYDYVPYVNNIYIKYKKRQWIKTWFELFKMRKKKYDLVIDNTIIQLQRTIYTMFINPKYAIASNGDKKYYGFDRSSLSFYYKTYTNNLNHIVTMRLRALEFLDIYNSSDKMEFNLPNKENPLLNSFIMDIRPNTIIGFNTEGSNEIHTLSEKQIIEISKGLKQENITIVLFCLPKSREAFKQLIDKEKLSNVKLSYETKSIYDAAELINSVDLLITPDTSFIHIASGLNIPMIGLFRNNTTQTVVWGPKSDLFNVVTPINQDANTVKAISSEDVVLSTFNLLNQI